MMNPMILSLISRSEKIGFIRLISLMISSTATRGNYSEWAILGNTALTFEKFLKCGICYNQVRKGSPALLTVTVLTLSSISIILNICTLGLLCKIKKIKALD